MSKFAKWLGAGAGFTLGGPIGAVVGFVVGSFIDGISIEDLEREREKSSYDKSRSKNNAHSGDFEISLLILSSLVIKADGNVDKKELDFVRHYFIRLYGKERANNAFKLFNGIVKRDVSLRQVCLQIRKYMSHSSRLQLIHFLFGIAYSDGEIKVSEEEVIARIAFYFRVGEGDFNSIKSSFLLKTENAYATLGVSKESTDGEVKKAYRRMVKKYHPDKLVGLGEEHIKEAKKKFEQIQKAYEEIKAEREV
ncbi:TerB family tellurite resistance protein [Tenacibaculum sp. C7A-26P2]|uniref:TerB family tellurite resistance protein n=1 Tax=Tenacibaculum sp. C7A-26P2 TaxID=3447504 RepID=UPI003F856E82